MKKMMIGVLIAAGIFVFKTSFAADSIKQADIQKVNVGDTLKRVVWKIGQPQEVVSKDLTPDGKEQTVWLYQVAAQQPRNPVNPFSALGGFIYTPPHTDENGMYHQGSLAGGLLGESPSEKAASQQAYYNSPQGQAAQANTLAQSAKTAYMVVFTNGKVSSIRKQ